MKKCSKIAIIGVHGTFPDADTLDDIDRIYSEKIDCIKDITPKRIKLNGLDENKEYVQSGYLSDIDFFDYRFFGISKHEAFCIDPQQRLALEEACKTIESAGYSLSSMKGTDTAVIVGCGDTRYRDIFEDESGFATNGTMIDTLPGRINYMLDLHGESTVVSTSCSSSLYAIYDACVKIASGMCDMALAGGVYISFRVFESNSHSDDPTTLGLMSADGRCKAFEDSADGINTCESAGFVLLKRYEDAVKDNDNILAVITAYGANQDGARSNSFSSPSAAAQAELLERVWRSNDIDPEKIGYIEAHGTGTKIGDPIEISSITAAFRKFTDKKQICPIGSLKSNFAHPGPSAGIASVIKAILSINRRKKYPLRTLNKPNTMIDFANSPVYPIAEMEEWNDSRRIMAINCFGVSGTNVHLVVENYDAVEAVHEHEGEYLVTVSTKEPELLSEYKRNIAKSITSEQDIADICAVLNRGRDDYAFRSSAVVHNIAELKEFLVSADPVHPSSDSAPQTVFLCSGSSCLGEKEISELKRNYPVFAEVYSSFEASCSSNDELTAAAEAALIAQYEAYGIVPGVIIGTGIGNAAIKAFKEGKTADIAALCAKAKTVPFAEDKFISYMKNLSNAENGNILCIDMSEHGVLLNSIRNVKDFRSRGLIGGISGASLLNALSELYMAGIDINWDEFYRSRAYNKVMLAPYLFMKTSAWPPILKKQGTETSAALEEEQEEDLKTFIRNLWLEMLELDEIKDDDDLFDLGANSLISMSVIQKIHKRTGVEMENDDLYDYCTINLLYEYLCGAMKDAVPTVSNEIDTAISVVPRTERMTVSGNQSRMLYIIEDTPNKAMYNMPICFNVTGSFNTDIFAETMREIVARHEILHTLYVKYKGEYYQYIPDEYDFDVSITDESGRTDGEIYTMLKQEAEKPFDLFSEVPIRCIIMKRSERDHLLFTNIHHIASDGWSAGIFYSEIAEIYSGKLRDREFKLPPLKVQYADYSAYESRFASSDAATVQIDFWKKELAGISGILNFPTDKKRPVIRRYHGASYNYNIPSNVKKRTEEYSKRNNMSMFMLLESVYALLLYKYSGENDICVGIPVACRNNEETEKMIGFFANTVVIRSRFKDEEDTTAFISRNASCINAAFSNSRVYFDEVVRNLKFERSPSHSVLYQYSFTYQNFVQAGIELDDLKIEPIRQDTTMVKFDMNFILSDTPDGINVSAEYDTDLFTEGYIREIVENFGNILNAVLSGEARDTGSIRLNSTDNVIEADNVADSLF